MVRGALVPNITVELVPDLVNESMVGPRQPRHRALAVPDPSGNDVMFVPSLRLLHTRLREGHTPSDDLVQQRFRIWPIRKPLFRADW